MKIAQTRVQYALALLLLTACAYGVQAQNISLRFDSYSASGQPMHIVRPGETLYSISRRYQVSVKDLMLANNMSESALQTGQRLFLPFTSAVSSQPQDMQTRSMNAAQPQPAAVAAAPATITKELPIYHQIKRGDNINSLSDTYEKPIAQIQQWNPNARFQEGEWIMVGKQYVTETQTSPAAPEVARMATRSLNNPPAAQPQAVGSLDALENQGFRGEESATRSLGSALPAEAAFRTAQSAANAYQMPSLDPKGMTTLNLSFYEMAEQPGMNTRFYAYAKGLPANSRIRILIPENRGFVEALIVAPLDAQAQADMAISPALAQLISAAGGSNWVSVTY